MIKIFFKFLILLSFTFSGTYSNAQEIPYQLASNYFVNNTYPDQKIHILKITSEQKFHEVFGMATTSGSEGKPTLINFSKNFVIAIIDSENSNTESIFVKYLTKESKKLNLRYAVSKRTVPNSATFRFAKILVVDKDFRKAKISSNVLKANGEVVNDKSLDDLQCYPSVTFTWSILEEKCIKPSDTKYTFIGEQFNTNGNAGLQFNKKNTSAEIMDSTLPNNLILTKDGEKEVWIDGNYKLEQLKKDLFILKENDKEIAIGKLRN